MGGGGFSISRAPVRQACRRPSGSCPGAEAAHAPAAVRLIDDEAGDSPVGERFTISRDGRQSACLRPFAHTSLCQPPWRITMPKPPPAATPCVCFLLGWPASSDRNRIAARVMGHVQRNRERIHAQHLGRVYRAQAIDRSGHRHAPSVIAHDFDAQRTMQRAWRQVCSQPSGSGRALRQAQGERVLRKPHCGYRFARRPIMPTISWNRRLFKPASRSIAWQWP